MSRVGQSPHIARGGPVARRPSPGAQFSAAEFLARAGGARRAPRAHPPRLCSETSSSGCARRVRSCWTTPRPWPSQINLQIITFPVSTKMEIGSRHPRARPPLRPFGGPSGALGDALQFLVSASGTSWSDSVGNGHFSFQFPVFPHEDVGAWLPSVCRSALDPAARRTRCRVAPSRKALPSDERSSFTSPRPAGEPSAVFFCFLLLRVSADRAGRTIRRR